MRVMLLIVRIVHEFTRSWDQKIVYFLSPKLSRMSFLTKMRKAKLKPNRERKGEPEGRELEQKRRPSGDGRRDEEYERPGHRYTICKHRYANAQATESRNQNNQLQQQNLLRPDENYDLSTMIDQDQSSLNDV